MEKPKERRYFQLIGGGCKYLPISKEYWDIQVDIYTNQGRNERGPVFVVYCPESNCKVLIQSNANGTQRMKLGATWNFNNTKVSFVK